MAFMSHKAKQNKMSVIVKKMSNCDIAFKQYAYILLLKTRGKIDN
jgi:hypothetical protein